MVHLNVLKERRYKCLKPDLEPDIILMCLLNFFFMKIKSGHEII